MIELMDKLNKAYAKLFKKCLTPKKKNVAKRKPKGEAISNMKRIKEFMIELMDKINKAYAKLFKKCLTPKKNVTKKKSTKS